MEGGSGVVGVLGGRAACAWCQMACGADAMGGRSGGGWRRRVQLRIMVARW